MRRRFNTALIVLAILSVGFAAPGLATDQGTSTPPSQALEPSRTSESTAAGHDEGCTDGPILGNSFATELAALSPMASSQSPGVTQTCGNCSVPKCRGAGRGQYCGVGVVCEIWLGDLCSDQQTWKCRCYGGDIP